MRNAWLRAFVLACVLLLLLVFYVAQDHSWAESCGRGHSEWMARSRCYLAPLVTWGRILPTKPTGTDAAAAPTAEATAAPATPTAWDPDRGESVDATVKEWLGAKGKSGDDDDDYRPEANKFAANCGRSLRGVTAADKTLESIFRFDLPVLLWSDHITASEFERLSNYRTPYGWKGMNWTDLEEAKEALGRPEHREMFDVVTQERGPTAACVRCAVVGNGGILAGSGKGKEIDAHDYVFRVNGAITAHFEKDVGTRTSFYFFSTNTLANSMAAYKHFGFQHPPWSEETRYVFVPCGHQDYYMVTAAVKGVTVSKGPNKYQSNARFLQWKSNLAPPDPHQAGWVKYLGYAVEKSPHTYFGKEDVKKKVKMLHPDFLRYLKNNFLPSTLLQTRYKEIYRPSTGAIALLTALHTCDQDINLSALVTFIKWLLVPSLAEPVSAYGFITSNYNSFPDHYFDPIQQLVFYANHDMNFERMLWKMLRKLRVMTLYQRRNAQ